MPNGAADCPLLSAPQVERECAFLLAASPAVCGFDTEWRATFVKGRPPNPTALIQLCYPKSEPRKVAPSPLILSPPF